MSKQRQQTGVPRKYDAAFARKIDNWSKHGNDAGTAEQLRQRKADYYAQHRDLDPQSWWSKMLDDVDRVAGTDYERPYDNSDKSYDWRIKVNKEHADNGDAPQFELAEVPQQMGDDVMAPIERGLGNLAPIVRTIPTPQEGISMLAGGYAPGAHDPVPYRMGMPAQNPHDDPDLLASGTDEDRALAQDAPYVFDQLVRKNPDVTWSEKQNPFPRSWVGKRQREGDAGPGALAHFVDSVTWMSPYSAPDFLSVLTGESPDTVERDIEAWKGGTSALDRSSMRLVDPTRYKSRAPQYKPMTYEEARDPLHGLKQWWDGEGDTGPEPEVTHKSMADTLPRTQNPFVDPIEVGSVIGPEAIAAHIGTGARAVKRAYGAGKKAMAGIKQLKEGATALAAGADKSAWRMNDRKALRQQILDAAAPKKPVLGRGTLPIAGGAGGAAGYAIYKTRNRDR